MSNASSAPAPLEVGDVVKAPKLGGTRARRVLVRWVDLDLDLAHGDLMGAEGGAYEGDFLGAITFRPSLAERL